MEGYHTRVWSRLKSTEDVSLSFWFCRIPAQRCVLAAYSDYFRAMFQWSELAESCQSEIRLENLDPDAVERLVNFCYTSVIDVSEVNVEVTLEAACYLQIEEIKGGMLLSLSSNEFWLVF